MDVEKGTDKVSKVLLSVLMSITLEKCKAKRSIPAHQKSLYV